MEENEAIERMYHRWEIIETFLADIDPRLPYEGVSSVALGANSLNVTLTRLTEQGDEETVVRAYKFAQRP